MRFSRSTHSTFVLVHFPIALFIAGFAFDLLGRWRRDRNLENAAYYNLLAAVATLPLVAHVATV